MFTSKKSIFVIITVILASGAYWYNGYQQNQGSQIEYRTENPIVMDIERTVSGQGKIKPKHAVDVGAQVSGQLDKLHFDVGALVTEGDLLAEIDPILLQARVDAGTAQLKELHASYAQQVAQIKLSSARAARNRKLYKDDAVSEQDVEATDAELEIAEARLVQLEAQVERNQSTLDGDVANLNYTKIYAPMSGTIVQLKALEGQTLNANQTTPTILSIANLNLMTIEADVSESDVSLLNPDMPVRFTTLGLPDRTWTSTVRQVLPQPEVLNDVVLYKALMDVRNDDAALLPEMTAQVFFIVGSANNALTIPTGALTEMKNTGEGRPEDRASDMQNSENLTGARGGMGGGGMGLSEEQIASFRARMEEGGPNGNGGGGMGFSEEQKAAFRDRMEQGGGRGTGSRDPARTDISNDMREMRGKYPDATMATVRILTDEGPEQRVVLVGLKTRTKAQILSGLSLNDEVIIGEINTAAIEETSNNRNNNRFRF
jgi:macrolide-specific efflux system membrane fusion protein